MPPVNLNLEQKFWDRVSKDKKTGCWLWTGSTNHAGYASLHVTMGKFVRAHTWAYEHIVGKVPKGKELDHTCRNRRCVNPEHLEPVTHLENVNRGLVGHTETNSKISQTRKRLIAEGQLVWDGYCWRKAIDPQIS